MKDPKRNRWTPAQRMPLEFFVHDDGSMTFGISQGLARGMGHKDALQLAKDAEALAAEIREAVAISEEIQKTVKLSESIQKKLSTRHIPATEMAYDGLVRKSIREGTTECPNCGPREEGKEDGCYLCDPEGKRL